MLSLAVLSDPVSLIEVLMLVLSLALDDAESLDDSEALVLVEVLWLSLTLAEVLCDSLTLVDAL